MKKSGLWLCAAACWSLNACDLLNEGSGGGPNRLFLAVKNTTPAFSAAANPAAPKAAGGARASMLADPAMNLAFQLLRDYSFPADEGKVDMTNIYKVLYSAGSYMADAKSLCSAVSETADSAISAYAFSDFLGHAYDCGGTRSESGGYGNSVAYRETGDDQFMLATYKWAPEPTEQITIGAIEAHLGVSSGDVQLTFAQVVDYPPQSVMGGAAGNGFSTRTRITGNSLTHAFELKIALKSADGINSESLVGKGISQGAGQHFLIRKGPAYYCLPAGATESDLAGIAPTARDSVGAACSEYLEGVDALVPYDAANPAQVPTVDLSNFGGGVSGTPVRYLMY